MKKYLLVLVAVIATAFASQAQRAELYFGYGGYTQMDATDMHDDWDHVNNAWGAVTIGVNFNVAPKFWLGPSYSIYTLPVAMSMTTPTTTAAAACG